MRRVAGITVTLAALVLAVFGSGGMLLLKCDCSGRTSVVLPVGDGCCAARHGCMSVTLLKVADSEPAAEVHADCPAVPVALVRHSLPAQIGFPPVPHCVVAAIARPPGGVGATVEVLRV